VGTASGSATKPRRAGQEGSLQLPTSLQARPLTLPGGVLRYDAGVDVLRVIQARSATAVGIHLGLGYGITDDLEVGGVLLPLQAFIGSTGSGEVGFGDMSLYGQYRFVQRRRGGRGDGWT
jgi:hypothetical protein